MLLNWRTIQGQFGLFEFNRSPLYGYLFVGTFFRFRRRFAIRTVVILASADNTAAALAETLLQQGATVFYICCSPASVLPALSANYSESFKILETSDEVEELGLSDIIVDILIVDASSCPKNDAHMLSDMALFDSFSGEFAETAAKPLCNAVNFAHLLTNSPYKRICFITGEAGATAYNEKMRQAALHMGIKLLFNALRPQGFSFRLICAAPDDSRASFAVSYFLKPKAGGDEDRLSLKDHTGNELPW